MAKTSGYGRCDDLALPFRIGKVLKTPRRVGLLDEIGVVNHVARDGGDLHIVSGRCDQILRHAKGRKVDLCEHARLAHRAVECQRGREKIHAGFHAALRLGYQLLNDRRMRAGRRKRDLQRKAVLAPEILLELLDGAVRVARRAGENGEGSFLLRLGEQRRQGAPPFLGIRLRRAGKDEGHRRSRHSDQTAA